MSFRSLVTHSLAAGAVVMSLASSAIAAETVKLFKIVTIKDEVVVGLTPKEIAALGGDDAGFVGRALKTNGELTAWQFAVRKGEDGQLEQAPLRRVSILGHDSLRVEPYETPLRVVPVAK